MRSAILGLSSCGVNTPSPGSASRSLCSNCAWKGWDIVSWFLRVSDCKRMLSCWSSGIRDEAIWVDALIFCRRTAKSSLPSSEAFLYALVCFYLCPSANFFIALQVIKNSGLIYSLIHPQEIGRFTSSLLPYTFKNTCLLLQLALWAAGEGQHRWIWASLFFLPL